MGRRTSLMKANTSSSGADHSKLPSSAICLPVDCSPPWSPWLAHKAEPLNDFTSFRGNEWDGRQASGAQGDKLIGKSVVRASATHPEGMAQCYTKAISMS